MHFFFFSPYQDQETAYRCGFTRLSLEQAPVAGLPDQAAVFFAFGPADGPMAAATFPADDPIAFETYASAMGSGQDQATLAAGHRLLMYLRGLETPTQDGAWRSDWAAQAPLPW